MERFADIIRAWPEPSAATLARDINRPLATVRVWRNRDKIPSTAWPDVVAAAKHRAIEGVTLEALASIAARGRGVRSAAATAGQSEAAPSPIPSGPMATANA